MACKCDFLSLAGDLSQNDLRCLVAAFLASRGVAKVPTRGPIGRKILWKGTGIRRRLLDVPQGVMTA